MRAPQIVVLIAALAPLHVLAWGTVADQFRKVISNIDTECKQRKSGPYLDRTDSNFRSNVADTSCDILKLQPRDWRDAKLIKLNSQPYPVPEYWVATPEGKFAHSIQLPPSLELLADAPKKLEGPKLFSYLCGKYAGQFVVKSVNDVAGFLQDRPVSKYPPGYVDLIFWAREKGNLPDTRPQDVFVQPPLGTYEFLEVRRPASGGEASYSSYERDSEVKGKHEINEHTKDGRFVSVPYVIVDRPRIVSRAQFAYTWRGIWPGTGVEDGIEGYELIVYRVQPFEVLGVMRDFLKHTTYDGQSNPRITATATCFDSNKRMFPSNFIRSVLVRKQNP